jgi:predicted  nucleic acid-binding Zn-ribbon protein
MPRKPIVSTTRTTTRTTTATARTRLSHDHQLRHLHRRIHELQEQITMNAADLQTALDALKSAVTKIAAEVATLKATPATIDQATLDATVAAVQDAATELNSL